MSLVLLDLVEFNRRTATLESLTRTLVVLDGGSESAMGR